MIELRRRKWILVVLVALEVSRNPVHLHTQYKAVVDGRDGNTLLQPVRAEFLQSQIRAEGGVYKPGDSPGREVRLNATCDDGQLRICCACL